MQVSSVEYKGLLLLYPLLALVVSVYVYSIVNILSFTLNVDYDLRIQYAGYSPAIPRNLLSRTSIQTYIWCLGEVGARLPP